MAEDTEAQKNKVAENAESDEASVSKEEKLSRVSEKLRAMGMMPGKDGNDRQEKPIQRYRGKLLVGVMVSVIFTAGLLYLFLNMQKQETGVAVAKQKVTGVSNTLAGNMSATTPGVVWPKALSIEQLKQLQEARQTYWQRNYKKSQALYRGMLDDIKDQPNLYGELGDVQFYSGQHEAAAESYAQAASLLIAQNRYAEVGHAISVVAHFDRARANELMEKMAGRHYPR